MVRRVCGAAGKPLAAALTGGAIEGGVGHSTLTIDAAPPRMTPVSDTDRLEIIEGAIRALRDQVQALRADVADLRSAGNSR